MPDIFEELTHPVYKVIEQVADSLSVQTYAVGGIVRDLLLNRKSKDIDILVVGDGCALAEAVAKAISLKLEVHIYKNFGTAQFTYKDDKIEFVGARKESYQYESRKPAVEGGTLEDDLNRRDFTINALAIGLNGPHKGKMIDAFTGLSDLNAKIIRTPLDPDVTFSDDPLRMMRAIRFATQLQFTIEKETFEAIKRNAHRLEIISEERIVKEFNKILLTSKPSIGINLLDESGLLTQFLPELIRLKGVESIEGKKHKDNYLHTLEVVDKIAMVSNNLWLAWAALLHDIAKPVTKKHHPVNGWSFHAHEFIGAKMVKSIFLKLKMPTNEKMKYVQKLVSLHLRPIALVEDTITDSALRRLLFDAGDDLEDLMMLCEADVTSKNPEKVRRFLTNFAHVRFKLKELEEKDHFRNWQPPIDGLEIMKIFNLPPCKQVGIIKTAIKDAILDGKVENNYEEAYKFMIEEAAKLGIEKK